ncbi:minor capsid protein [Sphingobacterium multivorum]|uniref:minor capsid protein n=1 Tax=Sphingobacterium multivorum TaxID=28454 RepID=UPI0028AAA40B|nr:minor capsid protein [Sphingobacterium multivorum]
MDKYYCCEHHPEHIDLAAVGTSDFGQYLEKLTREIWEKKAIEKGYDPELVKAYGSQLSKAVDKGYPKIEADFSMEDQKKIHSLKNNVWQFSTAKTYTQLKQMSDALVAPDGKLRTFDEFRIQAALISGEQLRHLKTEYQTAVAGAQMASKWVEIQRMKSTYPLLQFIAVEDEHTTALCRSLDGVIRPVDDSLWQQFYPPNHYNCRSTVKQLRKGEVTSDDDVVRPDIPNIFKVNLGERGLAFPEDHAYFTGTPVEVLKDARQHFPYAMQFNILDETDELKGIIRQHYLVDTKASDYSRLLQIAKAKATKDKTIVDIMPTLDPDTYKAQRAIIFPDAKEGKSADLRIDKILWEEEFSTKSHNVNNIKHAIGAGSKQANHIIITLSEEIDRLILDRLVNGRWRDHKDLKTIIFRFNDTEVVYNRP